MVVSEEVKTVIYTLPSVSSAKQHLLEMPSNRFIGMVLLAPETCSIVVLLCLELHILSWQRKDRFVPTIITADRAWCEPWFTELEQFTPAVNMA